MLKEFCLCCYIKNKAARFLRFALAAYIAVTHCDDIKLIWNCVTTIWEKPLIGPRWPEDAEI